MISLTLNNQNVPVLDADVLLDQYQKMGLPTDELEDLNVFSYAPFPTGSSGRFLVRSSDLVVPDARTGFAIDEAKLLGTSAKVTFNGEKQSFIHQGLVVKSIRHIDAPLINWTAYQTAAGVAGAPNGYVAVIELCDIIYFLDEVINIDYNLSSEGVASEMTWTEILEDVLSTVTIDGQNPTLETLTSELPFVEPKNLMTAGITVREFFQEVADRHFLVLYADKDTPLPGKLVFSNQEKVSSIITNHYGRLIHSSYGTEICPTDIDGIFSPREGCDIEENGEEGWAEDTIELEKDDDTSLKSNQRFQGISETDILYPFYDLDGNTTSQDTQDILLYISENYKIRTKRHGAFYLKDIVSEDPAADVQRYTYKMTTIGLITIGEGYPPFLRELRYIDSFFYRRKNQLGDFIGFTIVSSTTESGNEYDGLKSAQVTVQSTTCCNQGLLGSTEKVIDRSGCLMNEDSADLVGRYGWAKWVVANSELSASQVTPCHWEIIGLCCPPDADSNWQTWAAN